MEPVNYSARPRGDAKRLAYCAAALLASLLLAACGGSDDSTTQRVLYVSASASAVGDGSATSPFNSLAAVQAASQEGDTIIVLASPLSTPPLDGGIALKTGQQLVGDGPQVTQADSPLPSAPRITNASTANQGDAVTLADGTTVSNLVIVNTLRGAVYGNNVTNVSISGNDISGINTSCTNGLTIYYPPTSGLQQQNGWASVMIDADAKVAQLTIKGNYIHDGLCMDGIDLRANGTSIVTASVSDNHITRLQQGPPPYTSVLAIGMQTRDTGTLNVTSDGNSQTYLGSPFGGRPNANCEGLFSNQTGGNLTWAIQGNTFAHGIGGSSCNGLEIFAGNSESNATVTVTNSTFTDGPGDMIEQNNLGSGVMSLTLDRVVVSHARLATQRPPQPQVPAVSFGNFTSQGFCVSLFNSGPGSSSHFKMTNSELSDCDGDGVNAFFANVPNFGDGAEKLLTIDIDSSTISNVRQYGIKWISYAAVDEVDINVRNTVFTEIGGASALGLFQATGSAPPTVASIDFGTAASLGANCINPGTSHSVETLGYTVSLVGNWWGSSSGAAPATLSTNGPVLDTSLPLASVPSTCGYLP
jgi:hypothetical protein